ncbi:MAG TPA: hypothetical protein VMR99_03115 [Candidatus Paceibacterota bacterium]|nr:hypothetical protein [Candidatus Paceibacterota bacterium]
MKHPVQFGENVFKSLRERASQANPDSKGSGSELFILPDAPLAGIRLTMSVEEYFQRLGAVDDARKPNRIDLIPTENKEFPVMVNAPVTITDGKTFIDGREVVLVF